MMNERDVVGIAASRVQLFIGIDEYYDGEYEAYGYFWPLTEENERGIQRFLEVAQRKAERDYEDFPYSLCGPFTEAELAAIESMSRNAYRPRVNIIEGETDWDEFVRLLEEDCDPLRRGYGRIDSVRAPRAPSRRVGA